MAVAAALANHLARLCLDGLSVRQQHAGIQVSLQSYSLTHTRTCIPQPDTPVDAQHVCSAGGHLLQESPASVDEQNGRRPPAVYRLKYLLLIWQSELLVVSRPQLSGPGIKQLNDLGASFNLRVQVEDDRVRDFIEQSVQRGRLSIH